MKQIIYTMFGSAHDAVDTMNALQALGAHPDDLGVLTVPTHGNRTAMLITAAGAVNGEDVERIAEKHGGHRVSAHDAAPALGSMLRHIHLENDPYKAPETVFPEPLLSAIEDAVERGEQPVLELAPLENKTSPGIPTSSLERA